jgi:hypothetical protein
VKIERSVARCEDCPFCRVEDDNSEGFCAESLAIIDVDIEIERPDWCPLNAGSITIKVGEP